MASLTKEISAYQQMRYVLETDHLGKYVVVHDGKLEGVYDSFELAADQAVRRFGRGPYLIRKVGDGPVVLPASVLYRAVSA